MEATASCPSAATARPDALALRAAAESVRSDLYYSRPLAEHLLLPPREVFLIAASEVPLAPHAAFVTALSQLDHLRREGFFKDDTVGVLGRYWLWFADYLERRYAIDNIWAVDRSHALAWLDSASVGKERRPLANATWNMRLWALRLFFRALRELHLYAGDPLLDVRPKHRPGFARRRLTDDEHDWCRRFSEKTTRDARSPAGFALAEATGTPFEIPRVEIRDLRLADSRVWLDGADARVYGRWGTLSPWGVKSLERRLRQIGRVADTTPVIYEGGGNPKSMVASTDVLFSRIFERAGLYPDEQLKPDAVRAWAGAKLFEHCGNIREVAHRLGLRSLDKAATLINLDLLPHDEPPPHRAAP